MKIYGLIGYPLEHSRSPEIFREIFQRNKIRDAVYNLYPLRNIDSLRAWVRSHDISGFNVTIPHKVAVIQYLDELQDEAKITEAVNCVSVRHEKGKLWLKGYNTDAPAFYETLKSITLKPDIRALILGSGGVSRAVRRSLETCGIPYLMVTRNPVKAGQISYRDISPEIISTHHFIINTTPLGMFPHHETLPDIPYQHLTPEHIVYDLVYNPEETLFLQKAKLAGSFTMNGMLMLKIQAEKAWRIWTETK